MDNQALYVSNVSEEREDLEAVDELERFFLAALDIEGEDGTCSVREESVINFMVRVISKCRVIYLSYLGVIYEEIDNLLCILHMAVKSQGECLDALQEQERIER